MSEGRTLWSFADVSFFYELVNDDYQQRFDGEYQYTKDIVLGATTAAQSYIDLGGFVVAPMQKRIAFSTSAARQTFQALIGTTATLSNDAGLSYTATLLKVTRIEGGGGIIYRADAIWEQR
jgi:hypothetical protein